MFTSPIIRKRQITFCPHEMLVYIHLVDKPKKSDDTKCWILTGSHTHCWWKPKNHVTLSCKVECLHTQQIY